MKKLLLIGTESIHLLNYYNLVKDYFDEILVVSNSNDNKFFNENIKLQILNFSVKNLLVFVNSISKLKKIIEDFNPSVIHTHQIGTNSLLAILANKQAQKKIIATAWGSDILFTPQKGFFYKKMVKYILNNVEYLTSDSLFMASEMEKIAKSNLNISIANFGINLSDDNETEKQNVIYSNRQLNSFYRIDLIILAFSKFIKGRKNENWKLIIAGDGSDKDKYIEQVKKLNISKNIEFVGWLNKEQNTYYYSIAKFYVSIPISDATSISLLEAMYMGCIPILSNLPANTEWVIDGLNGIITSSLTDNFIEKALLIDFEKAIKINKELIINKGTQGANKLKFISLYNKILNISNE